MNNKLSEMKFQRGQKPSCKETKQRNESCTSSQYHSAVPNLKEIDEQVVPNAATIIAKPNFQGAAHDIIQRGAFY